MKRHISELAQGLRLVQQWSQDGSLELSGPVSHKADREEMRLAKRISMAKQREEASSDLDDEDGDFVYDVDSVQKDLLDDNTKSFLSTLLHKDSQNPDKLAYKKDGFEENMPLPISADQESVVTLKMMTGMLAALTGITFTSLGRKKQKGDNKRTTWEIKGHVTEMVKQSNGAIGFFCSFQVGESDMNISDLDIQVGAAVRREVYSFVTYSEERSCFRTFCSCFGQYGQLYQERERLFRRIAELYPENVRVLSHCPVDKVVSRCLKIEREDSVAYLVWKPYFVFQNNTHTIENQRSNGHTIRTNIDLWVNQALDNTFEKDRSFASLVRYKGLTCALEIFCKAFIGTK
mmetsp:Transcript_28434/g.45782  ORF Transcript_28434/g.45782 Transcript_28434/m.45782 type:complete len:347 (-) Transcript_28434:4167-5207(-)